MGSVIYDYVIVGGGLTGCALASRLRQYRKELKILIIEAGPDTRSRTDILQMQALNLGGPLDWQYQSEPTPGLLNRTVIYNQGKALGGGSCINSGGWTRGSAVEYDEWADVVGDERWSYKGQLPWMKKTEHWFDNANPDQHGSDGPLHIQSGASIGRKFPLAVPFALAWDELGVPVLRLVDQNAGDNLGRAYICEARRHGQRQWSASVYPLEGVEILTDTLVKRVVLARDEAGGAIKATGVELANGTIISSKNVVCSAGSFRSPQLLMLSGIGPSNHLKDIGIEPKVDLPDVGQGLTDHMSFFQHWRLRKSGAGYTLWSDNPIFQQPKYALGLPLDWIVCSDVPKDGLAEAIKKDEGSDKDVSKHPLVSKPRSFLESFVMHAKLPFPGVPMDTDHLTTDVAMFLPTSRGTVTLQSADSQDAPKINLNYLGTETDKYLYRQGLRQITQLMLGTETGREYIAGESVPEGLEPLSLDDSDEKLDKRLALAGTTTWHASGTCSMGKVVDSEFRVRGVEGLRVIDASVIPVPLSAHLQAPLYALAEQAAAILAGVV
ncbi:hypothetical protein F5B20DRAFT_521143 [Whalleya microplaca]|nr:hypothetical protein F5B20DRAFT_521143 [Whalleya microplaca]